MLERIWRKGSPPYTVGRKQIGIATMKNSMESLNKLKIELPYDPTIPLLGLYPEKMLI